MASNLKPIVLEIDGKPALATMKDVERAVSAYGRQLKAAEVGSKEFAAASQNLGSAKGTLAAMKAEAAALSGQVDKSSGSFGFLGKLINSLPGGQKLGQLQSVMGQFGSATQGASGATAGLSLRMAAMAGIYGIIIAVISAVVGWFLKLDSVMEDITAVTKGVMNVLDLLANKIKNIGDDLGKLISNPIGYFSSLGDDMKEAYTAANELSHANDELEDAQRRVNRVTAEAEAAVSQLLLQAKNRKLSEEQRIELLKKAGQVEQDSFKQSKAVVEQEVALEEQKLALTVKNANKKADIEGKTNAQLIALAEAGKIERGSLSDEELNHYVEVQNKKTALIKESNDLQEKIENRQAALEQEIEAERNRRLDERKKREEKAQKEREARAKAEHDLIKQLAEDRAKSITDEVERAEKLAKLQAESAREEIRSSKASRQLRAEALMQIDFQLGEDLRKIQADAAKKREEDQAEQAKKEREQFQRDAEAALELEALLAERRVRSAQRGGNGEETARAQKDLEDALVAQEEFKRQILLSNTDLTEQERQLIIAQSEDILTSITQKGEDDRNNLRNQGLLKALDTAAKFTQLGANIYNAADNAQLAKIEANKNKRLNQITDEFNKGIISKTEYEEQKAKIDQQSDDEAKSLKREQFQTQKLFNIVMATIAAARAVVEAAVLAGGNYFDPRVITAGIIGAAEVGIIASQQPPQFEKGGVFNAKGGILTQGSRHREGGVKMVDGKSGRVLGEMEGGEAYMILSRETVRNYGPEIQTLIDISKSGGQRSGAVPRFETGGVFAGTLPPQPSANDGGKQTELLQQISAQLAEANARLAGLPAKFNTTLSTEEVYYKLKDYEQVSGKS